MLFSSLRDQKKLFQPYFTIDDVGNLFVTRMIFVKEAKQCFLPGVDSTNIILAKVALS